MRDFLNKYKVSIGACVMMAMLGVGTYFVLAQTKTTIGDSIHVIGNLTTGGNVGIGTTSPAHKLDVSGGTARFSHTIEVATPTAINHAATKAYVDSKDFWRTDPFFGDNGIYYNNGPVYVMDQQGFAMPDKGGVLTVSRDNVPVSTSTLIGGHGLVIRDVGNLHNAGPSIAFGSSGGIDFDTMTPGAVITYERTSSWNMGKLHFWIKGTTAKEGALTPVMTINDNSNIGIGTASPTAKLEINQGSNQLILGTGDGNKRFLVNYNTSDNVVSLGVENGYGVARIGIRNNGAERISIRSSGNVGIGTTSPGAKLDVNGDIGFSTIEKEIELIDTTARTYVAGTWYNVGSNFVLGEGNDGKSYIIHVVYRTSGDSWHNNVGAGIAGFTTWKATGTIAETNIPIDTHVSNVVIATIRGAAGTHSRGVQIKFSSDVTVGSGGYLKIIMKRIF